MPYEVVTVERNDGVGIICLNRPKVLNAMSFQLTGEVWEALKELDADDEIKTVILTGAGERAFCAGADIHEMAEVSEEEAARRSEARKGWIWYLADYRKPTIAALNGLAYGGGAVLASVVDIRVGCERTNFRFLAASYGRINSTWTLPMLVGWGQAKELLLTGRVVPGDEAFRIGLLNHLVPADQVMAKAMEIGQMIVANHAESVQGIKRLLHEGAGLGYQDRSQLEVDSRDRFKSTSVEEGFKDFLERKGRRKPE